MLLAILAFAVSLVPSIALFLWLRGLRGDGPFKGICNRALGQGALCVFLVILCSACLHIVEKLLMPEGAILTVAYHNFFVLALSEEFSKLFFLRRLVKKTEWAFSWLDIIALMTIVGIGFGLVEDIPYALMTNPIQMLVRGIDIGHGGYGFIMGYFIGKGLKTGKKPYFAVGFGLPWLLHGLYDFTLSEEALNLGEWVVLVPVLLALFSVSVIVFAILFLRKARNNERYTTPLPGAWNQPAVSQ